MRDRREEALARVAVIIENIPGIRRAFRNKDNTSGLERPLARLFDGDEIASGNVSPDGRPRSARGGRVMIMQPTVGIAISAAPEKIGSELNAMRLKAIVAIETDSELLGICGLNGFVKYDGLKSDFREGIAMDGEQLLQFAIGYPLIPAELTS